MKPLSYFSNFYLYCGYVDFRKGINGLSMLIDYHLKLPVFEGCNLFVFCNRQRNKLRILYWDKTGFALWHKQLEEDHFKWPKSVDQQSMSLSHRELEWLLEGVDITKVKTHSEKYYKRVV